MTYVSVFALDESERKKAYASRAFLDGVEVTHDCQIADDEAGRVLLLKCNADGFHYVDDAGDPVTEWKVGKVEIRPK